MTHNMIFQFLNVHKLGQERKFWMPCKKDQEQLCLILKTEKCHVTESQPVCEPSTVKRLEVTDDMNAF